MTLKEGATVLGTAVADGGGVWTITSTALGAGAHSLTATATDAAGNESVASGALNLTIDTTPPDATSSTPGLAPASDSGASDSDNLTNDTTPSFSGLVLAMRARSDGYC